MKVLIVSSNRQKVQDTPLVAFPSGPAYVAGAVREAGHQVEVFDACFSEDVTGDLTESINRFRPDVVGISIRNLSNRSGEKPLDLRPVAKEITDCIKRITSAKIVLGGPAFWNFGPELLEYLDLDFGIRGEGELTFPLYLDMLEKGADTRTVPGSVSRTNGTISEAPTEPVQDFDSTPFPALELFEIEKYNDQGTFPTIVTKRGCSFHCTYCPRNFLEGSRYRLKSPERVVAEIEHARETAGIEMFYFADNTFNFPTHHAEAICRKLIERDLGIKWTADGITPLGMDEDFCLLLKESGCVGPCLAVESGSEYMLKRMKRGYTTDHVREAAANLERAGISFSVTLLLGSPGETPETISESVELIDSISQPQLVLATIGLYLEHNQAILADALKDGQLDDESDLFDGRFYLSPELVEDYIDELVESLKSKSNWFVEIMS